MMVALIISVAASAAAYYICKWLDSNSSLNQLISIIPPFALLQNINPKNNLKLKGLCLPRLSVCKYIL
jgi:hypothetical protein